MKKIALLLVLALANTQAFAAATRTVVADTIESSDLTKSFTLPSVSDVLAGKTVPNGGTGAASFMANGMLYGGGTSALNVTAAGTQFQVFQAGSSGVPAIGALHLDQAAAVTGTLPVGVGGIGVANPTTGGVLVGAGSSPVTTVTCSTSGNVLTWGGSSWSCVAPSSGSPALNGGSGTPQTVTAGSGVALTGLTQQNFAWFNAGSAVTVTATPSVTAGTADGQKLVIQGSVTMTVGHSITLQDSTNLSGSGLVLNGNWTGIANSVLSLHWDNTQGVWVEDSRQ